MTSSSHILRLRKHHLLMAGDYIHAFGRPVDMAMYDYVFEGAPKSHVMNNLTIYMNADGGFGRGLALDYRYDGSTPVATAIAFQYLRRLQIIHALEFIEHALEYWVSTQQPEGHWLAVTPETASLPRASWRDYTAQSALRFTLDPTAEIAGYFYAYGGGSYRAFARELIEKCLDYLKYPQHAITQREMVSVMRLIRILPDAMSGSFSKALEPLIQQSMSTRVEEWDQPIFRPLDLFEAPYDPLYSTFSQSIEHHISHLLSTFREGGYWDTHWQWDQFDDDYIQLLPQIRASETLRNLLILQEFGRIS